MVETSKMRSPAGRSAADAPLHDLLALYDGRATAANALAYAEALAPDGHVAALLFGILPDFPVSEGAAEAWLVAERAARAEAAELEARLRVQLEQRGSRAELRRTDGRLGEEGRLLAREAMYADATLIGWPAANGGAQPIEAFEGALFNSGRPVILVPEAHTSHGRPQTVLIAWRATREAARAVNDALPLLRSARQVTVVVVADNGATEDIPGDDIARHLARHDVWVEVKHVPAGGEPVHEVLLNEARFVGADLMVMGGYSHSRTGEWLFGGVTRDMLSRMTIPVLMSH